MLANLPLSVFDNIVYYLQDDRMVFSLLRMLNSTIWLIFYFKALLLSISAFWYVYQRMAHTREDCYKILRRGDCYDPDCREKAIPEMVYCRSHLSDVYQKIDEIHSRINRYRPPQQPQSHNTCGICHDKDITHALDPCGHLLCESCTDNLMEQAEYICPYCRQYIENELRIYL